MANFINTVCRRGGRGTSSGGGGDMSCPWWDPLGISKANSRLPAGFGKKNKNYAVRKSSSRATTTLVGSSGGQEVALLHFIAAGWLVRVVVKSSRQPGGQGFPRNFKLRSVAVISGEIIRSNGAQKTFAWPEKLSLVIAFCCDELQWRIIFIWEALQL